MKMKSNTKQTWIKRRGRDFAIIALFTATLLSFSCFASAQSDIVQKPFARWTKAETNQMLTRSPWAKTQEVRVFAPSSQSIAGAGGVVTPGNDPNATFGGDPNAYRYTARLRSALPVRQAIARAQQLQANYDSLPEAERVAFDARARGLLQCPACEQNYVVTVSSYSVNVVGTDDIYGKFRNATLPQIKPNIYLANERGERRELIHFIPPKSKGGEVTFFFPRFDDAGKPLFTTANKKIIFRLNDKDPSDATSFEFDIAKLVVNGEVQF